MESIQEGRGYEVNTIGSKCPGISGTVPDLAALSLVPEGPSTSLSTSVPDPKKNSCFNLCYSANCTLWLQQ